MELIPTFAVRVSITRVQK